jgi:hypothetical protein
LQRSQAWTNVEHVQYTPGDVRAVGITLFQECRRQGVALPQILAQSALVEKALTRTDDLLF